MVALASESTRLACRSSANSGEETVDAVERQRILGQHRPAPYIGSPGLEPHLGPACRAVQPLVMIRPSVKPAQIGAEPPTLSVTEAK